MKFVAILVVLLGNAQGFGTSGREAPTQSLVLNRRRAPQSPSALKVASLPGGLVIDKTVAIASVAATTKLLSSIGIGGWAATKPNLLDAEAVSSLSRLTYWLFQPCFLLVSVSRTVAAAATGSGSLPLILMPVAALAQVLLGSLIAKGVTTFANFPPDQARDMTVCLTFGNAGPLPLIFSDTLPFSPAVRSDVVACVSFYLLLWSPLFWSFGRVILGTYGNQDDDSNASGIKALGNEIRKLMSPPVIGCLVGVLVGAVPPLRGVLLDGIGSPFFDACKTLGSAYVPAAVLVLAGSLFGGSDKTHQVQKEDEEIAAVDPKISKKALLTIMFSRFIISPICALALVRTFGAAGVLKTARSKAIITFVILMEGCMPPAQNSVIILQLDGMKKRAKTMAKTLTILYSLSVVPVTILLSACLAFSGILSF